MSRSTSSNDILQKFSERRGQIAVLIDPDKFSTESSLLELLKKASFAAIDYFFVGGSTVSRSSFLHVVKLIKKNSIIPVVLFPGAAHQISEEADALLYLSLISGRNPDYLIGQHIISANEVYDMDIEVIPTAYMLIEGGTKSSVAYVSQTTPIPCDKESIILDTAKAGILQGKKLLYLDAGSGAKNHVPVKIVNSISKLSTPIIIGGGIKSKEAILSLSSANVIVIGNKIEDDIDFLLDIKSLTTAKHE
tara:strand:+ start:22430 stop:23176 length:747 start_codon:yes stop_codon:yes gene_type:complete